MPAIVYGLKIDNVSSSGTVNMGDAFYIAPKNASESYTGAGSGHVGDWMVSNTFCSLTNVIHPDGVAASNIDDN